MTEQEIKELLELAAKSIGMTLRYNYLGGRDANQPWNPIEDYGDTARLQVKLRLGLVPQMDGAWACIKYDSEGNEVILAVDKDEQLAITRGAAVLARKMK